jgi:AraC-like DNA-binding protein
MRRSADLPEKLAPVTGFKDCYPASYVDKPHAHDRCQLSFNISGVMTITTETASFVLPPNRAVWIPAGMHHQASCKSEVEFIVLYVAAKLDPRPSIARTFEITPLVRALIDEVAQFTERRQFRDREQRVLDMLMSEIELMPHLPACATLPTDRRLKRVCDAILADPADARPLDEWADVAGMGRRTFTRAFRTQTGLSLSMWRRQVRLMEAASRIAAGESVSNVAFDVGYESPSSFIAMFHKVFGEPPGAYCRR